MTWPRVRPTRATRGFRNNATSRGIFLRVTRASAKFPVNSISATMSEKTTRRGGRRGQSEAKQVKRQKLDHNSNTQVVQPMHMTPITNPLGPFQPVSHSSMV